MPCDVWADSDNGLHFVLFPISAPKSEGTHVELHMGFAVATASSALVAAGLLRTEAGAEGWRVQNIGSLT